VGFWWHEFGFLTDFNFTRKARNAQIILAKVSRSARMNIHTHAGWVKYEGNPVLGGALETCFDVAVLKDGGRYKMYFSWRPQKVGGSGGAFFTIPFKILA
jgi:hypothetical protein